MSEAVTDFNCWHPAHLEYVRWGRRENSHLILTTESYTSRLKWKERGFRMTKGKWKSDYNDSDTKTQLQTENPYQEII